MTTTTLTKTARTLISAGTVNAANGTTEGTPLDLRTANGGIITGKVANGATGPTAQAIMQVLIAHSDGSTPAGAAEGSAWKLIAEISPGTGINAVARIPGLPIDAGVQHVHVRVTGNTGQAVTCEAFFSEITSAASA